MPCSQSQELDDGKVIAFDHHSHVDSPMMTNLESRVISCDLQQTRFGLRRLCRKAREHLELIKSPAAPFSRFKSGRNAKTPRRPSRQSSEQWLREAAGHGKAGRKDAPNSRRGASRSLFRTLGLAVFKE
jgi:hypothetical protein